jgi:hypothetical protein
VNIFWTDISKTQIPKLVSCTLLTIFLFLLSVNFFDARCEIHIVVSFKITVKNRVILSSGVLKENDGYGKSIDARSYIK